MLVVVVVLVASLLPTAVVGAAGRRTANPACPADLLPELVFDDVAAGSTHARGIRCLLLHDLVAGRTPSTFAPDGLVTRGQLATFLLRVLERLGRVVPVDPPDAFGDDDASVHEPSLDALAKLGVFTGVGGRRSGVDRPVTRAQLAALVVRLLIRLGLPLDGSVPDAFVDDDGHVLEPELDRAAALGLLRGSGDHRVEPAQRSQRDQVATIVAAVLGALVDAGLMAAPERAPRPTPTPTPRPPVAPPPVESDDGDVPAADVTAPTGTLQIEGDAAAVSLRSVTLQLRASDDRGVTQMRVADGSDPTGAGWQSYAATLQWTLPEGADGARTVSAQFRDAAGNVSLIAVDTVELDRVAPTFTGVSGDVVADAGTDALIVATVADQTSGVAGVELAWWPAAGGDPTTVPMTRSGLTWTAAVPVGDAGATYRITATDAVGNTAYSPSAPDAVWTVTPSPGEDDVTAPTGTLVIDDDRVAAATRQVTLTLSASDDTGVTQMRVADGPDPSGAAWQDFADELSWTVPAGADGSRTVSAQFRDAAGNESAAAADGILLDRVGPVVVDSTGDVSVNRGTSVSLRASVTDATSGVAGVALFLRDSAGDVTRRVMRQTYGGDWARAVGPVEEVVAYWIEATDVAGNTRLEPAAAPATVFTITPVDSGEFEPPPLTSDGGTTTTWDATRFVRDGPGAVQRDTDPDAFEGRRAAGLRGVVTDGDDQAIVGVRVEVLDHPEYGWTLTREGGAWDLSLNGGELLTLVFSHPGFLTAHRQVKPAWLEWSTVDTVKLVRLDPNVTTVTLDADDAQAVVGSTQTDDAGERTGMLVVPAGTSADVVEGDASTPAEQLSLRITEYTVGDDGSEQMPAELPPTSGYTYAFELSADEALDADSVEFDQPLVYYVDNFLDFPVGTPVPTGSYDRTEGRWEPERNGAVIEILTVEGGVATVDLDGDGVADPLDDAEARLLGAQYPAGTELWRVQIPHLTPWDCNWPYGPPDDARPPRITPPKPPDRTPRPESLDSTKGSVNLGELTLTEALSLPEIDATLAYDQRRTPGAPNQVVVELSGADVPASLRRIELGIDVAGRHFGAVYPAAPNQSTTFTWDGLDAFGRKLNGAQLAQFTITYVYPALYRQPGEFEQSFSRLGGAAIAGDRQRTEIRMPVSFSDRVTSLDSREMYTLGGWHLPVQAFFDPVERTLYRGDGTIRRNATTTDAFTETIGPGDSSFSCTLDPAAVDGAPAATTPLCFPSALNVDSKGDIWFAAQLGSSSFDGVGIFKVTDDRLRWMAGGGVWNGPVVDVPARSSHLRFVRSIEFTPDGRVLIGADTRILVIDPDGVMRTFAGTDSRGFDGDGGPATEAEFSSINGIEAAPDGTVYVADLGNRRVRAIGTDGIVTTVAGNGDEEPFPGILFPPYIVGPTGEGGPATQTAVPAIDVAVAPDGALVLATENFVRRVGVDGIVTTLAGRGKRAFRDHSDGPALEREVGPEAVEVTPDGTVWFVAEEQLFAGPRTAIRRLRPDGYLEVVFGGPPRPGFGDVTAPGGPARLAAFDGLSDLVVMPDGSLVASERLFNRLVVASAPAPAYDPEGPEYRVVDGQTLYEFDADGRHVATRDARSERLQVSFEYDDDGLLERIVPARAQPLDITRSEGSITITSATGAATLLLDEQGWLDAVEAGDGRLTQVEHLADGRIAEVALAGAGTWSFTYGGDRRITQADEPDGRVTTYDRVETATGDVLTVTSPDGTRTVATELLPDSSVRTTTTETTGFSVIEVHRIDGTSTRTLPSGVTIDQRLEGDPVDGMQAPYLAETRVRAPDGKTAVQKLARSVERADPDDGESEVVREIEEVTVNGKTRTREYDLVTKTMTEILPSGRTTVVEFDENDNVATIRPPGIAPTHIERDDRERPVRIVQESTTGERVTELAYDGERLASMTDPLGRTVSWTYDEAGRTSGQVLGDGVSTIGYRYDEANRLVEMTTAAGGSFGFDYDDTGHLTGFSMPDVGEGVATDTLAYDGRRTPTGGQLADGRTITRRYNAEGRLEAVEYPDNEIALTYLPDGNLATATSDTGPDLANTYNGNLGVRETWSGEVNGWVERLYDAASMPRLSGMSVNGVAVTSVRDDDGLVTGVGGATITRAPSGLPTEIVLGDVTEAVTYDDFGQPATRTVTGPGGASLYSWSGVRNIAGHLTRETESVGGQTVRRDYTYDAFGHLASVVTRVDGTPQGTTNLDWDADGNLESGGPIAAPAEVDARGRLLSDATRTLTWDDNGHLVERVDLTGTTTYDYDGRGLLTAVHLPGGVDVEYTLDAFGRRVAEQVDGVVRRKFLYRDGVRIEAELAADDSVVSRFVYGGRQHGPLYMVKGDQTYRFVTDGRGSVRRVVNVATGDVAQEITYDAFGRVLSDSAPGFQPFGFAAGVQDNDTKLSHFGVREYDPSLGRWTTADQAGLGGGSASLYTYAGGDPVNYVDPSGMVETNPELVKELFWALAHEEQRIGGWSNMFAAYGAVDCTEHALFGDVGQILAPTFLWGGLGVDQVAWHVVADKGGVFLPKRDHDVKLADGRVLDMRWFIHGYLSSRWNVFRGTGWIPAKYTAGLVYNRGNGYGNGRNANVNLSSLELGMEYSMSGMTLDQIAYQLVGGPPVTDHYKTAGYSVPGNPEYGSSTGIP